MSLPAASAEVYIYPGTTTAEAVAALVEELNFPCTIQASATGARTVALNLAAVAPTTDVPALKQTLPAISGVTGVSVSISTYTAEITYTDSASCGTRTVITMFSSHGKKPPCSPWTSMRRGSKGWNTRQPRQNGGAPA